MPIPIDELVDINIPLPADYVWPDAGRYHHSVLEVAQALHSAHIGTGDPLSVGVTSMYVCFLHYRLRTWQELGHRYAFDECVRQLMITALTERELTV